MKKFIFLMTALVLLFSCNKNTKEAQVLLDTKVSEDVLAFLTGTWKLVNASIPFSDSSDYASHNVVFDFKSDRTLTITGKIFYDVDVPIYKDPIYYDVYVKDRHKLIPGNYNYSLLTSTPGNPPAIMIGDTKYSVLRIEEGQRIFYNADFLLLYLDFSYSFKKIK